MLWAFAVLKGIKVINICRIADGVKDQDDVCSSGVEDKDSESDPGVCNSEKSLTSND